MLDNLKGQFFKFFQEKPVTCCDIFKLVFCYYYLMGEIRLLNQKPLVLLNNKRKIVD
jgi:hypothetical protein